MAWARPSTGSIQRFFNVFRHEGPSAALELAARRAASLIFGEAKVYYALSRFTDHLYDWRHHVDTGGVIGLAELKLNPDAGRNYIGIAPRTWKLMMRHLPINPEKFTYVDIGCGKGRSLILAAERGFLRRIGVDLSPDLIETARRNLDARNAGCELICQDATQYEFPN